LRQSALALDHQEHPDIALIDLRLPGEDRVETLISIPKASTDAKIGVGTKTSRSI